jgi:hypothetical protein
VALGLACFAVTIAADPTAVRRAHAQDVPTARAPESPPVTAPLAGAVTAFLPFVAGSLMVAQDGHPGRQRDGITLMTMGFAAAPWVAHSQGRWRHALLFGLATMATSAGTLLAMTARDPFDPTIGNHNRLAFGFFFSASFFLAAGGIADSFIAGAGPTDP